MSGNAQDLITHKNLETGETQTFDGWIDQGSGTNNISFDGNIVLFTDNQNKLFTKNLDTGVLTRVDQSKNGNNGNDQSQGANATLSSDGNVVAFVSNSTNLLDNYDVSGGGLYTKNLTTGDVELISRKLYDVSYEGPVEGNLVEIDNSQIISSNQIYEHIFSADNNSLIFVSPEFTITDDFKDINLSNKPSGLEKAKIYKKDLTTGELKVILPEGILPDNGSNHIATNFDGSVVTFNTYANNISPDGNDGYYMMATSSDGDATIDNLKTEWGHFSGSEFETLQHSNWSSSNFLDDSQRDVILVDNTNEIGKWTTGFSNSADQYYSIIQYDSSSAANQNYKILSDGTVMWFYQDTDNIGNIDIWSQRIDLKTGETSTPQLVNNITTGTQFKPTVYEFNDGNFVVGWLTDFGVAYQYFDENGNEVGDEGSFQSTTAEFPESLSYFSFRR